MRKHLCATCATIAMVKPKATAAAEAQIRLRLARAVMALEARRAPEQGSFLVRVLCAKWRPEGMAFIFSSQLLHFATVVCVYIIEGFAA